MANRRQKKIKSAVDKLLTDLGIPSTGNAGKKIWQGWQLLIAVTKPNGRRQELVSSLSVHLNHADAINQFTTPDGSLIISIKIKK